MSKYQNKYRIETTRLPDYDYSQPGAYFVTICTYNRVNLFGEIINGQMFLNECGKVVEYCWKEIPQHYPQVTLDEFVLMPNHLHGIIIINNKPIHKQNQSVETQNFVSLHQKNQFQKIIPGSVGSIVRGYKTGVSKWYRQNTNINNVWQRNYYEHIIRNEKSLYEIRNYIQNNPLNWESDEYNIN